MCSSQRTYVPSLDLLKNRSLINDLINLLFTRKKIDIKHTLLHLLLFFPLTNRFKLSKMKLAIFTTVITSVAAFTSTVKTSSPSNTALFAKKFKSKMQYVPCVSLEDLPEPGSATSGVAGGLAICIAVDPKGAIYALGDKCPPVNQPLSFGKVTTGAIEDPVLGTNYDLKTGKVIDGTWCSKGIGILLGSIFEPIGVPTYPVKKGKGTIDVQVDVNYKLNYEADYWSGVLDAQGKANGKYY